MSKLESYGVSLLPIALAAGILSGTLFRQAPTPETAKPAPKPPESVRQVEDTPSSPWLSDLRPVMETIGDAMGLPLQRDASSRALSAVGTELDNPQPAQVTKAIATLRDGLLQRLGPKATECGAGDETLASAEQTLNGYLLSDQDSSSRKLRSAAADAIVNQVQDWRSFVALTREVSRVGSPHYSVKFIVATVPDYVDSNAGWFADQSLAAIQSAMSRADYVLDRFRLIDWTRNDPRADNPVANDSRLHERQPGALIFRQPAGTEFAVVLLILETPTSGVHRAALRNSIRFIRAWNRCTGVDHHSVANDLKLLGPTFSGSSLSMALTLGERDDDFGSGFHHIQVISGSATADSNSGTFTEFAPKKTTFNAALPPTSETRRVMSAFLEKMNPEWQRGSHMAILQENNTAYGQTSLDYGEASDNPFLNASEFTFPLHISQLRSDAPAAAAPAVTLLPTPAIPLDMRETTPPADQIPALRPLLTASVVESTVDTILDTIRHERLTAVGIQATDDRDVLFLAREVKRAVPDVQLFFLGAHALYLHQDYVPYLRGTLVASPYPLSLTTQAGFTDANRQRREPYQSMSAEGLFNATLLLMDRPEMLVDYCPPDTARGKPCMPRVAVSVIGEDGFWPVAGVEKTRPLPYALSVTAPSALSSRGLPPLPTRASIVVTILSVFVVAQIAMLSFVAFKLRRGEPSRRFLEWPVLRVLAPPTTSRSAATLHRLSLLMCYVVVALLFAWMATVVVPFRLSDRSVVTTPVIAVVAGLLVLVPAIVLITITYRIKKPATVFPEAARRKSSWMLMPALVLLVLSILSFVVYLVGLVRSAPGSSELDVTLARVVGGGIVSPAPATLCLFAALYTGMFAAMRRATLVGTGYTALEERSPAFGLLSGRWAADSVRHPGAERARLGDVLDQPAQNLPVSYVLGILLVVLIAGFSVGKVSAVDGRWFSWFLRAASATVLMLGLMNLAQGLVIWNTSRSHLKWLALSPIEGAFKSVGHLVPWDLSLAPPRLIELMPVARRADRIVRELRALAVGTEGPGSLRGSDELHRRRATDQERRVVEVKLGIRRGDLDGIGKRVDTVSKVRILEREIRQQQHAALMQSASWWQLWNVSDAIVEMLKRNVWQRVTPPRHVEVQEHSGLPVLLSVSSLPAAAPVETGVLTSVKLPAVLEASPDSEAKAHTEAKDERAGLFRDCEEFVALQFAFVLRDIVARTVAALFTAMLCLTFLTAAHLLYSFNGRASLLTVDLLAVAAAAVTSIWILVGMEREPILSRLRNTTPGRLDINWAFVQRVAVYGVLPLLAVLASLFPEIGNSLFGWLEPLRKLSSF